MPVNKRKSAKHFYLPLTSKTGSKLKFQIHVIKPVLTEILHVNRGTLDMKQIKQDFSLNFSQIPWVIKS